MNVYLNSKTEINKHFHYSCRPGFPAKGRWTMIASEEVEEEISKTEVFKSYASLAFEIISKLGYILPSSKHAEEIFLQKYQPSMNFKSKILQALNR